jgi:hypothetical protein
MASAGPDLVGPFLVATGALLLDLGALSQLLRLAPVVLGHRAMTLSLGLELGDSPLPLGAAALHRGPCDQEQGQQDRHYHDGDDDDCDG